MKTSPLLDAVQAELNRQRGQWPTIASKAGLDYSWLSKLAQGKIADPGVRKIEALAAQLGVSVAVDHAAKGSAAAAAQLVAAPIVSAQERAAE